MFNFISKIQNVKNYIFKDENVIIQNDKNQILERNQIKTILGTDLTVYRDYIAFNNYENVLTFENYQGELIIPDKKISLIGLRENRLFAILDNNRLIEFTCVNQKMESREYSIDYVWENIKPIGKSHIILWNKKVIKFLNVQTIIWQTSLSSYGTIRKVLGVCGENVWVTTQFLDEHRTSTAHLIALNIHTGEVRYHLSDNLPLHEVHIELIEETQTIVSTWGKISTHRKAESPFVEIDAKTGSVVRNTFSETLFEANLKLGGWKYFNGKLYFDAAFDTINSTHIGVMDFNTLELEWFEEVKERKAGLRNLQVTENKIYVMDSGHQLFIYEKTS